MENKVKKIRKIYKKGDFFGVQPKLYTDSHTKYNTTFGASLTYLLFIVVVGACWVYGKDMYYKENPNSIQTEESSQHPEKFILNKNTLNFGFMLSDLNSKPFSDPTIFTYKLQQRKLIITKNEQGEDITDVVLKDLRPRPCKVSDFGVATEYFSSLIWLETLYCMDEEEAEIEGDYGSEVFTQVQGLLYPCKNSTDSEVVCKSQEVIDETLKDKYWSVTISDSVLDPKNYEKPLKPVGRDIYGFTSGDMFRMVDINFRNVYIEDNVGWMFDQWEEKKGIQYSNTYTNIKTNPLQDGCFFQFNVRLEKVKYTKLFRTYLNIAQVLANIGGVLKVVMITFMIVSEFVSHRYYNLDVVNSLFKFHVHEDKNEKDKKNNKNSTNSSDENGGNNPTFHKKSKQNSNGQQLDKHKDKLYFRHFIQIITQFFSRKEEKTQKEMYDYSVSKLSYHLDIKHILQKLIEIDRLKALLLNEQQQQLFEYLPKPVINEQMVHKQSNRKQFDINDTKSQKSRLKHIKDINLLFEDTRTDKEKQEDAFQAFKNIHLKNKKSKVDLKIIQIMDKNLRCEFNEQLEKKIDFLDIKVTQNNVLGLKSQSQSDIKDQTLDINSFMEFNNNKIQDYNGNTLKFQDADFGPISEEYDMQRDRENNLRDSVKEQSVITFQNEQDIESRLRMSTIKKKNSFLNSQSEIQNYKAQMSPKKEIPSLRYNSVYSIGSTRIDLFKSNDNSMNNTYRSRKQSEQ